MKTCGTVQRYRCTFYRNTFFDQIFSIDYSNIIQNLITLSDLNNISPELELRIETIENPAKGKNSPAQKKRQKGTSKKQLESIEKQLENMIKITTQLMMTKNINGKITDNRYPQIPSMTIRKYHDKSC